MGLIRYGVGVSQKDKRYHAGMKGVHHSLSIEVRDGRDGVTCFLLAFLI